MKKEKGITLVALTLYVVVFIALMGLLALISADFNEGIDKVKYSGASPEDFNKFNIEFLRDVKSSYYSNIEKTEGNISIVLDNGTNYKYIKSENAVYRNQIKIAKNIISFDADSIKTTKGKNAISVKVTTGKQGQSIVFDKTIRYILKYW